MNADDQYEQQNDVVTGDVPAGDSKDDGYVSRTGQKTHIPVQKDSDPVEDPIDPANADSDQTLGKTIIRSSLFMYSQTETEADDKNAIDQSNVINERTRGAAKQSGTYTEPGDEEVRTRYLRLHAESMRLISRQGLPGPDDGTSAIRK